ncbi:MAG: FxsA family protein [Silicimonas sp.]|nr:FxsA family protein [Silicimonas sp.]
MRLLLLFLLVPLIEIALFIKVGGWIGLPWTLIIVVLTAILGTFMVRSQGLAVLSQLQGSLADLRDPTEPLAHGAMILFSGALLLTPGFFTDVVGFSLLVPSVRASVFRFIKERVVIQKFTYGPDGQPPRQPDVIDGEYEEIKKSEGPSGWTRH